jgi:hypothetical protein
MTDRDHAGTGDIMAAWHGVPVAWAAVASNGQPVWLAYNRQDAWGAVLGTVKVVPLYAAPPAAGPTLTDAEREIIELHALRAGAICRSGCVSSSVADQACSEEVTLRGLLARAAKEAAR